MSRKVSLFSVLLIGVATIAITGCARLFGQKTATVWNGPAIVEIPTMPDWIKSEGGSLNETGTKIQGSYWSNQANKWKLYKWTQEKGTREVSSLTPSKGEHQFILKWSQEHEHDWQSRGNYRIVGMDATPDHKKVVGWLSKGKFVDDIKPFIWTPEKGVVELQEIFSRLPGAGKYRLEYKASDISDDGSTVLCHAFGPLHPRSGLILVRLEGEAKETTVALRLTGTVSAITPGKWTVAVSSVTTANGKTTRLSPGRKKVVLLPKGTATPPKGAHVTVMGQDAGSGKPITAESVEVVKR